MARGIVYLVGAGPGDPGLITVKGLECIRKAEVLSLERARAEATATVKNDSDLVGPRGAALRLLLHIFERDVAVKLLSAG